MKLAQRVRELTESATLAVTAKAARMIAEGIDVVSFAAGEPDFDTPAHIVQAAITAMQSGRTRYPKPASGLIETKRAVCTKFARDNQLSYLPEQILITTGGKMAVYLAMQTLIDPGDEIVIPKPYWVSYPEMAKLAGGVPVFVAGSKENDYRLTPDILVSVLTDRTKVVLLNSPCNPSGVTLSPDHVRALADVLQGRDLWVLSDEIYDRLLYDGQETLSYAAVSDESYAQTITLNSASKSFAMTGWRLGYAAGPCEIIQAMAKLQSQMTSGAATFSQSGLACALTADQSAVEVMRAEFGRRAKYMHQRLVAIPGVTCPKPTGAFYCFPNASGVFHRAGDTAPRQGDAAPLQGVSGSAALADRLLEEAKVAVVPGIAFGLDEHVRLSFATDMERIRVGLDRLEAFLMSS